jgi:hypothetical protein
MRCKWLLLSCAAFACCRAAGAGIAGEGFTLVARDNKILVVDAADKESVFEFGSVNFAWSPQIAEIAEISPAAAQSLRAVFTISNDPDKLCAGHALFTVAGQRIIAQYVLTVPATVKYGGMLASRRALRGGMQPLYKSGFWTRHEHGGVPYERPGAVLRPFATGNLNVLEVVRSNPNWNYERRSHLCFVPGEQPGEIRGTVEYLVTPAAVTAQLAAAALDGAPIVLAFHSDQPNHIWASGEQPSLQLQVGNSGTSPLGDAQLRITARNFAGEVVYNDSSPLALAPLEQRQLVLSLPTTAQQDIFFLEATAKIAGQEYFTRSNIAFLDDYEFSDDPDSPFGMAAAFYGVPDRDSVFRLMRRIGVAYIRNGDNRESSRYGITSFYHDHYTPDKWRDLDAAGREDMLRKKLDHIVKIGAPVWEFGNENKILTPEAAGEYVGYLRIIRRLIDESGAKVKLLSIGFANGFGGVQSLRLVHAAGGWPLLDGIAYHIGRGNMTPDYAGDGDWTYLSSLNALNVLLDACGRKPIYLTEVYTCTKPNSWWHDSQRRAAENVVLSYALARTNHVTIAFHYQLHDSVWFNVGGVSETDNEYFYGLLDRFGHPKPPLLAFQATARQLDGATFVRKMSFPEQPSVNGLLFRAPDGQDLALLWDRSEGYWQSEKSDDYAALEPWLSHWQKTVPLSIDAAEDVTLINPIGQQRNIAASGGKVTLFLDGTPIWVRGKFSN